MRGASLNIKLIGGFSFPFGSRRYFRQNNPISHIPALAPHILKAVTPPHHQVEIQDFRAAEVDPLADIVGMSFTTSAAARANRIADVYRRLGITTVAGGVHASLSPEDALQHFDAVVIGPGELAWPRVLRDFQAGTLQEVYQGKQPDIIPFPDRTGYPGMKPFFDAIEISRGCSNVCGDFCTVPYFYGPGRYFARLIDDVITEMEGLGRYLMITDNNIVAEVDYARNLFERMAHLGKRWIGAATPGIFVKHPELAPLMKESGCSVIFVGLETLVTDNSLGRAKKVQSYLEGIKRLHDAGIGVEGSFVIGLPCDTAATLEAIPGFVDRTKLEYVSLNILTPFPGTGLFNRMQEEGRILTTDWSLYDTEHVVFKPHNFETPDDLQEAYHQLVREVFSLSSIVKRSVFGKGVPAPLIGAANLVTRFSFELAQAANKIRPFLCYY